MWIEIDFSQMIVHFSVMLVYRMGNVLLMLLVLFGVLVVPYDFSIHFYPEIYVKRGGWYKKQKWFSVNIIDEGKWEKKWNFFFTLAFYEQIKRIK